MLIDFEGNLHLDSHHRDDRTVTNTTAEFRTYLTNPLQFSSDDFEVGLHEIQLPSTYWNITKRQFVVGYDSVDDQVSDMLVIDPGCYYTVHELIGKINELFHSPTGKQPRLEYDYDRRRVISYAGEVVGDVRGKIEGNVEREAFVYTKVHIFMSRDLAFIMGFEKRYLCSDAEVIGLEPGLHTYDAGIAGMNIVYNGLWKSQIVANKPPSMNNMLFRIFVHSNIVKRPCHISHNLLRVIPLDHSPVYSSSNVRTFDRPIFSPLSGRYFDSIDIRITDNDGNLVTFQSQSVVLTLEIRKKYAL